MVSHGSIEAIAGKGLLADRYATGRGHYSGVPEWDAHVTFRKSRLTAALRFEGENDCN